MSCPARHSSAPCAQRPVSGFRLGQQCRSTDVAQVCFGVIPLFVLNSVFVFHFSLMNFRTLALLKLYICLISCSGHIVLFLYLFEHFIHPYFNVPFRSLYSLYSLGFESPWFLYPLPLFGEIPGSFSSERLFSRK